MAADIADESAGPAQTSRRGVAVVTGGSSGIGFATATLLVQTGWDETIAGRRQGLLDAAVRSLSQISHDRVISSVAIDVAEPAHAKLLVRDVLETHGRLDALVSCAGVLTYGPLIETTANEWRELLDVNLRGTALVSSAAARHMCEHGGGRIVLVGSVNGIIPSPEAALYSASKAAIQALGSSVVTS